MEVEKRLLNWLQLLVRERVSEHLTLTVRGDHRRSYRLSSGAKAIDLPVWEWQAGDGVSGCSWYVAERDGLRSALDEPLPAPGVDRLRVPLVESTPEGYQIHFDIIGFAYWALSRCEEVGRTDLDAHGRFPATSSHAYKHGYLERPVVDEWLHLLKQVVKRLWPEMPVVQRRFDVHVSHDIDRPSKYALVSGRTLGRNFVGDIVKRRDWTSAHLRLRTWITSKHRLSAADPFNTFGWIMSRSEHHDLTSCFYLVCGRTDESRDPAYDAGHPAIRQLLRSIRERGHLLGLHASYNTHLDPVALGTERRRFGQICAQEGFRQDQWGCRMHYLRWVTPVTANYIDQAGLSYDATLGYADAPGFRCGTCYDYQAFDPVASKALMLRIRPLIAMECAVISPAYLGLGVTSAALSRFIKLKNACRSVGGTFTLLWHNSELATAEERDLYDAVLRA